jgi:hypothetical protein
MLLTIYIYNRLGGPQSRDKYVAYKFYFNLFYRHFFRLTFYKRYQYRIDIDIT